MARQPRNVVPGGIYHVFSRGNRQQRIFQGDGDRVFFEEVVSQVVRRRGWHALAYCLLTNHYHLVVQTPQGDLSAGMHVVNGQYAQWFNKVHGFVGHLFQDRFCSVPVETDWHLLELLRYLALNPVRAGLCASPGDWRWSSYPAALGLSSSSFVSVARLLSLLGPDETTARDALRKFVERDGVALTAR